MSTVRISDLDSDILFFCRMIAVHVEFMIVKVWSFHSTQLCLSAVNQRSYGSIFETVMKFKEVPFKRIYIDIPNSALSRALSLFIKYLSVSIQMKATKNYFRVY